MDNTKMVIKMDGTPELSKEYRNARLNHLSKFCILSAFEVEECFTWEMMKVLASVIVSNYNLL